MEHGEESRSALGAEWQTLIPLNVFSELTPKGCYYCSFTQILFQTLKGLFTIAQGIALGNVLRTEMCSEGAPQ